MDESVAFPMNRRTEVVGMDMDMGLSTGADELDRFVHAAVELMTVDSTVGMCAEHV